MIKLNALRVGQNEIHVREHPLSPKSKHIATAVSKEAADLIVDTMNLNFELGDKLEAGEWRVVDRAGNEVPQ